MDVPSGIHAARGDSVNWLAILLLIAAIVSFVLSTAKGKIAKVPWLSLGLACLAAGVLFNTWLLWKPYHL